MIHEPFVTPYRLLALVVAVVVLGTTPAHAAGVVGTGTAGSCTDAALDVALMGGGLVTFNCGAAPVTIVFQGTKVIDSGTTTIQGGGHVAFDGENLRQLFYVIGGASLSLSSVTLQDSRASNGGAVLNQGELTLTDVTLAYNTAEGGNGGAVYNDGALFVSDSSFLGNAADVDGGAIYATNGSAADMQRSLFSGNAATNNGGALALNGVGIVFTLTNSTLTGNAASRGGGLHAAGSVTLLNDTLEANRSTQGGALWHDSGTTRVMNTILHGSRSLDDQSPELDCDGIVIVSDGHNVMGDGSCNGDAGNGDQIGVDPMLGALAENGGPTWTLLPGFGSPAIDAGTNAGCPSLDQRSAPRPLDGDNNGSAICDVGAVEVPEPGAALTGAAGLVSLLILTRRRETCRLASMHFGSRLPSILGGSRLGGSQPLRRGALRSGRKPGVRATLEGPNSTPPGTLQLAEVEPAGSLDTPQS